MHVQVLIAKQTEPHDFCLEGEHIPLQEQTPMSE